MYMNHPRPDDLLDPLQTRSSTKEWPARGWCIKIKPLRGRILCTPPPSGHSFVQDLVWSPGPAQKTLRAGVVCIYIYRARMTTPT